MKAALETLKVQHKGITLLSENTEEKEMLSALFQGCGPASISRMPDGNVELVIIPTETHKLVIIPKET